MRSLRIEIMLAIPLPDTGTETDPTKAFAELPAAVRTRAIALRDAIRAAVADARALGPMEPVRATVHVCRHDPDGANQSCGPLVELR